MAGGKRDEQAHPSSGYDRPSNGYDRVQEEETDHINVEMSNIGEEQALQHLSPNGNARGQEEEPDHINVEMLNIGEEQALQHPSPQGNARQEKEPEPRSCFKKRITIIIGIGVGIAIAIAMAILIYITIVCPLSSTMENQKTQAVQTGTSVPLNSQKDAIKCLPTCPKDWIGLNGNCYKLSEEEKNWNESRNACILQNATLAKITEEEIAGNDIMRMFTKLRVFWIGLTREPNQPWKYLDGENATMEVKGNGGDCAFLDEELTAMSVRCSTEHYYMCKITAPKRS